VELYQAGDDGTRDFLRVTISHKGREGLITRK
jgi:hypothetical protein